MYKSPSFSYSFSSDTVVSCGRFTKYNVVSFSSFPVYPPLQSFNSTSVFLYWTQNFMLTQSDQSTSTTSMSHNYLV